MSKIPNMSIDLLKPSEHPEPGPSLERLALESLATKLGVNPEMDTNNLAGECYRKILHLQRDVEQLDRLRAGASALVHSDAPSPGMGRRPVRLGRAVSSEAL